MLAITGSHRSGTSSVAQYFHENGVYLGDDLISGNQFNKSGYFEDKGVVGFHEAVLSRNGESWTSLCDEKIEFNIEEAEFCKNYAASRAQQSEQWAFKDPRTCRFLDNWSEIFPEMKFLFVYRAPDSAARSLMRRSGRLLAHNASENAQEALFLEDPDLALKIWLNDNSHIYEFSKKNPEKSAIISYEDFLDGLNPFEATGQKFSIHQHGVHRDSRDYSAKQKAHEGIFCTSTDLMEKVNELYDALQSIGIGGSSRKSNIVYDDTRLKNILFVYDHFRRQTYNICDSIVNILEDDLSINEKKKKISDLDHKFGDLNLQLIKIMDDIAYVLKKFRFVTNSYGLIYVGGGRKIISLINRYLGRGGT